MANVEGSLRDRLLRGRPPQLRVLRITGTSPPISIKYDAVDALGRRRMLRSTSNTRPKWALALRRERHMAIGLLIRVECELPEELPSELTAVLVRNDKGHDPYVDIVGTC